MPTKISPQRGGRRQCQGRAARSARHQRSRCDKGRGTQTFAIFPDLRIGPCLCLPHASSAGGVQPIQCHRHIKPRRESRLVVMDITSIASKTSSRNEIGDVNSRHENNPSFLPNPEFQNDAKTRVIRPYSWGFSLPSAGVKHFSQTSSTPPCRWVNY